MELLAATPTSGVLLWVGVLIVVAMVGGLVMVLVRRSMLGEPPDSGDAGLMEQLRGMVERGEMTQEEYDLARRKIVERARAGMGVGAKDSKGEKDLGGGGGR